ncbi:MAG: tetratricopeptide repeat protein, partial [Verrucomicrobiota bacterium]|nr:tetratricopeptide repeat protein [Verrucomicrobiota bacterium]
MKQFMNDQNAFCRYLNVLILLLVFLASPQPAWADDQAGDAAYEAAAGLFNLGLWEQSAAAYQEYFDKHPRHSLAGHAHYGLGLAYFNLKDYAAATTELKAAAGKGKGTNLVEVNLYLGQSLMMQKPPEYKTAEGAFAASLKELGFDRKGFIN